MLTCANVCDVITEAGPAGLTAVGVHFLYERKLYTVKARREVILSAGYVPYLRRLYHLTFVTSFSTLKSPQILELSGIGRRDVLEKIGVPVKVELPGVGENLQDHPMCGLSWGAWRVCVSYRVCGADLEIRATRRRRHRDAQPSA